MFREIVFASTNQGKLKEVNNILSKLNIVLHSQQEFNVPEVEETGTTFVENAILKAKFATQYTDMPVLADDSGLVVDALDGEPGVYSARYSGVSGAKKSQANMDKLLTSLQHIKDPEKRTARFYCALALMRNSKDSTPIIATGTLEGRILFVKQGDNGFGYDPVFYIPEYDKTAAQISDDLKNSISHRARALGVLCGLINN